ncbi:MAG: Rab family GTPase [Candidatus Thorarchaeota archaeon]
MSLEKPLKVVIAGEKHVGKSSLVHRFLYEQFPLKGLYSTVGFDFTVKSVEVYGKNVVLHVFDFGGETKFRMVFPQYAEGCDGLILAFDPSREETLDALHEWLRVYGREDKSINFLISTKSDLGVSISPLRINEFRNQYPIEQYIATSAVTGENTQYLFQLLAQTILDAQETE